MIVLDKIALDEYKTKTIAAMLKAVGSEKKALIVLPEIDEKVDRFRELTSRALKPHMVNTLNVYDILNADKFIVLKDAVAQD